MKLLSREKQFYLIEHWLLPVAFILSRILFATYRVSRKDREKVAALFKVERLIIGCCHGHILSVLPFTRELIRTRGSLAVLSSPSRDGRIGIEFVRRLGARSIVGSSSKRGVAAAAELARALRGGEACLITFDGPRGPRLVPKGGALRLGRSADARLFVVAVTARYKKVFGSWDRMFLPLPFSMLRVDIREFNFIDGESDDGALARLGDLLSNQARETGSPLYVPGEDGP